jgi:hypothetical protein
MPRLLYDTELNLCISEAETGSPLKCRCFNAEALPAVTTPCIVLGGESLFWQLGAFLTVELISNETGKRNFSIFLYAYHRI